MSKDLARSAAELERMAEDKAATIRRVVREYNDAFYSANGLSALEQVRRQREIERVVAEYVQLYKALKRLRKKMRAAK